MQVLDLAEIERRKQLIEKDFGGLKWLDYLWGKGALSKSEKEAHKKLHILEIQREITEEAIRVKLNHQ